HAQASDITAFMVINNGMHVAEEIQTSFTALPPGGECEMVYFVTFSSQIPAGTVVNISTMLFSGDYSSTHTYAVNLGIVAENFESGFSSFPWEFTGGNWTIDAQSYNNTNSARSATITHNETTSMTVTLSSDAPGTISFWKKVSSEQNYDYLRFYINGIMKNQWSGTSDVWSQVNYDVQAGMNIYKWEYSKDSMVSSGSDCAWIDDIVFPTTGGTTGAPAIALDATSLDFGDILIGQTQTLPFTVHNNGDAVLIGTVEVEEPFCVYQGNGTPMSQISIVVDAGSFLTYNVCFTPLDETDYTADMLLSTDDPANPQMTVQLTGTGQPVANDDPVIPAVTELKGNFPNPFNPVTTILYSVKEATPVSIGIYNVKGQLVRIIVRDEKAAGNHEAVFDGLDDNRAPLSSGVYFYRMKAGDYTGTRRMIMLK
ncbi:MAG: T9SS type A sorting domain-containing protein, partial [Candidatus Syntrophosphaera sp.]